MSEIYSNPIPEQENIVKLSRSEALKLLPYKESVLNIGEIELDIKNGSATAIMRTKREDFENYMADESLLPAYKMILAANSLTQVLYRKMYGLGVEVAMPYTSGERDTSGERVFKEVRNQDPLPILKIVLKLNPQREGIPAVQSVCHITDEDGEKVFFCRLTLGVIGKKSNFSKNK